MLQKPLLWIWFDSLLDVASLQVVATPAAQIHENNSLFDLLKCAFTLWKVLHLRCLKSVFQKHNAESVCKAVAKLLCSQNSKFWMFCKSFYYNLFILLFRKAVFLFVKNIYYCSRMTVANLWLGDVLCFQCCMCVCVCVCVCISMCSWPWSLCAFQGQTLSTKL